MKTDKDSLQKITHPARLVFNEKKPLLNAPDREAGYFFVPNALE